MTLPERNATLSRGQRAVLDALRAAGTRGITTNEFLNTHGIGSRYSARIHELRKEHGYTIRRERLSGSAWRFTLELGPVRVEPRPIVPETGEGRLFDVPGQTSHYREGEAA